VTQAPTSAPVILPMVPTGAPIEHPLLDCWEACQGAGYCSWCGEGNSCCKQGNYADPMECRTASAFTTLHHECVRTDPLLMSTHSATATSTTTTSTPAAAQGWSAGGFALMLLVILGCCGAVALAFHHSSMGPGTKRTRKVRSFQQDEEDSPAEVDEPLVFEQRAAGLGQSPSVSVQPAVVAMGAPVYTSLPPKVILAAPVFVQGPTVISTRPPTAQTSARVPVQGSSTQLPRGGSVIVATAQTLTQPAVSSPMHRPVSSEQGNATLDGSKHSLSQLPAGGQLVAAQKWGTQTVAGLASPSVPQGSVTIPATRWTTAASSEIQP